MPINLRVKNHYFYLYFASLIFFAAGCTKLQNSRYDTYLSQKYEIPECLTNYNYTSATAITGTANFYKRGVNLVTQGSGATLDLKNMTLGDPLVTPLPIKFAEIAVYDPTNKLVQCGKTDAAGNLKAVDAVSSLMIPAKSGQYTVRVFARMNYTLPGPSTNPDFDIHVAIKQDKYTNEVHYIAGTTFSNGLDDSSVNLTAYARQTDSLAVQGGAFNILNSIYTAYSYVRANTDDVDATCMSKKLNVYWKLGFNPFQYLYPSQDPYTLGSGSFYDKTTTSLYVTGGKLGDISTEVTNHFDDYVIIHELAHHIEDVCGQLLTPGGSHHIIARIDPRLAWAEAWANYFSAEVMYNSIDSLNPEFIPKMTATGFPSPHWTYLFASEGFSDSYQNIGTGSGFMFDLKKPGNNPDTWQSSDFVGQPFDKVDPTKYFGEGHFREGAITRGLFKLSNLCGGSCITANPIDFANMWRSMDRITGIGRPEYTFKSSADFMEKLKNIIGSVTWASTYKTFNEAATSEALNLFSDGKFTVSGDIKWPQYGTYLTTLTAGACSSGTYSMQPKPDDPVFTSTNSDQRYSNHYYTIDLNVLTGLSEINVAFTKTTGTDTEFDIILYADTDKNYFAVDDYSCPAFKADGVTCSTNYQPSRGTNEFVVRSDRRSGAILNKRIRDLQSLSPNKRYMLNIRAYTANRSISTTTEYQYTITDQNGMTLCP
jgi:hypothetical protein